MNKILGVIIIGLTSLGVLNFTMMIQSYKKELRELNSKIDKLMVFLDLNDKLN